MNNMFKKTLIAAALAGLSTSAIAAELHIGAVPAAPYTIDDRADGAVATSQFLAVNDDLALTAGFELILKLGANYTANDVVKFTFTGESLDTTTLPSVVSATDGGTPANEVTFGLISTSVVNGNIVANYRVTDVSGNTIDLEPDFGLLTFDSASIASNEGVSVSFEAETNTGLALDTSGGAFRSLDLVEVADQFSFTVTALDETIDVEEQRLTFVGGNSDAANFALTNAAGDFGATYTGLSFTLNGSFGWLLDEDGDLINAGSAVVACTGGTVVPDSLEITSSAVSVECNDSTTAVSVTFDASVGPNENAIPTQTFTYSSAVAYSNGATETGETTLSGAAGAWDLNGSQVNVSYMPYRSGISQVINLTNRSSQSGAVSVIAYPEGGGDAIDLGEIATVSANGLTRIAGAIIQGLSDETGVDHSTVGATTRYALEITTNAPAESIEVYSAYNVGGTGARLVVNDSNGGAVSKQ